MEELLLDDKEIVPTDEYVIKLLEDKAALWKEIHEFLEENFPDASGSWNYYNDGKRWLYKMVRKKKTIFWGALLSDAFRITIYFGNKAEPEIVKSSLPAEIISGFISAPRYGLIRPVSIKVMSHEDVENIIKLIALKMSLK
jgi:hypothetical protein